MPGLPRTFAGAVMDFVTARGGVTTYLTLLNTDPGDDAVMVSLPEIADAGYARQLVTYLDPLTDPLVVLPATSNVAMITFGPFPSGMAEGAAYVALVEAAIGTTGKVRYVWALDSLLQATPGESVQFPADSTKLSW